MARRRYLITYDVSSDRRRSRIFDLLRDHGDHAQFSVFFCELNQRELAHLKGQLTEWVHRHEDQILILDLGFAENPLDHGLECLGKAFRPPTRVQVV